MKSMECSESHLSLFGRPRFKGSDAQSLQTKSCCFKERCCILFDIPLGIEYSAMSTECVPARNLLELVWPVLHDWQLLFTMWPKVGRNLPWLVWPVLHDWQLLFTMWPKAGRNLPWLVWPVLHERRQSFSIWPKVGKARRTPHPAKLHTPPCFDLVLPAKLHIPAKPAYMQNYFSSSYARSHTSPSLASVAHSNFGWYKVLVENCHLLMQLSRHVKVKMDT